MVRNLTFEIIDHDNYLFILSTISIFDMIIIMFGTIGNLTSFYLLTRKRIRSVSSMRYLSSLTIVDTLCLYGWYLSSVYRQLNDETRFKRLENISSFMCKFISYLSFSSLQLSSFLLCVLTVDRLLIIKSSVWRSKYANQSFANKLIIGSILFFLSLNLVIPIHLGNKGLVNYRIRHLANEKDVYKQIYVSQETYENLDDLSLIEINKPLTNFTMWHCYDDNDLLLKIWNKLHLCLYSLIPFPILFVLNLVVIRITKDAARSASQLGFNKFKHGQQFVTRLLLFLTISFILTTLPSSIAYAFWHYQILQMKFGRVLLNLLNTLQFSRHSSNWIIYIYSSSYMREEFKKCLACSNSDYEIAQAALADRPSVAIEILRQIELDDNLTDHDQLNMYYLYYYYEKNRIENNLINEENNENNIKQVNLNQNTTKFDSSVDQANSTKYLNN